MATSVVCGGAGFVGSHLVDALVKRGQSVFVLDDLSNGRLANLESSISSGRVTFVYSDSSLSGASLAEILLSTGVRNVNAVYVVASDGASPFGDGFASHRTLESLIEFSVDRRSRFLFAAYDVVGTRLKSPIVDLPVLSAVQFAEAAVSAAIRERNLDARILHLGACYGPRSTASDSPVAEWCESALQRRPLPIRDGADQMRTLTYVNDAVARLLAIGASSESAQWPIEISAPEQYRLVDVARTFLLMAGVDVEIEHVAASFDEQSAGARVVADAQVRRRHSTSLADGLRLTYDWFAREHREFV